MSSGGFEESIGKNELIEIIYSNYFQNYTKMMWKEPLVFDLPCLCVSCFFNILGSVKHLLYDISKWEFGTQKQIF